jgi:hypothetical protein
MPPMILAISSVFRCFVPRANRIGRGNRESQPSQPSWDTKIRIVPLYRKLG